MQIAEGCHAAVGKESKAKERRRKQAREPGLAQYSLFKCSSVCTLFSSQPAGEVGLIGQPLTCCQVLWSSAGNAEWVAIPGRLPHSSPAVRFFMLSSPYRGCLGGRLAWRSCTLVGTWRQNVGAGQYWGSRPAAALSLTRLLFAVTADPYDSRGPACLPGTSPLAILRQNLVCKGFYQGTVLSY